MITTSENIYGEQTAFGIAMGGYMTFVYQYHGSKTRGTQVPIENLDM
tara:strand:+ start:3637 stop:3777 length:141 start_codon:yes stop_codon:yes gene_type:complete